MPRARARDVSKAGERSFAVKRWFGQGKSEIYSRKKNMSAFWGESRILEKQGLELGARPQLYPLLQLKRGARGGIGSCPSLD